MQYVISGEIKQQSSQAFPPPLEFLVKGVIGQKKF